jgi:hypothetical protein
MEKNVPVMLRDSQNGDHKISRDYSRSLFLSSLTSDNGHRDLCAFDTLNLWYLPSLSSHGKFFHVSFHGI